MKREVFPGILMARSEDGKGVSKMRVSEVEDEMSKSDEAEEGVAGHRSYTCVPRLVTASSCLPAPTNRSIAFLVGKQVSDPRFRDVHIGR